MTERILPIAAVDRLIRKAGASRVSEDAAIELAQVLEEYGVKIGKKASEFAVHANRKTVVGSDVRLASKDSTH